ncbi:MAG: colA [Bacteroidetes bacterium]|nr:colA [Bacteroidota bacterium]
MKNRSFLTTTLFLVVFTSTFVVKAQVPPGIVPANGIPVLVPATVGELNTPNSYCQLSYGTSGLTRSITSCDTLTLAGHQLGSIANSHVIITTPCYDSLACNAVLSGPFLATMPEISYWDTLNYGPLRVMKLGDQNPGPDPFASVAATYYFTPTEEENFLLLWISFVTQVSLYHDKSENGLFRVEMTDINGNYVTGNYYTSTFYIIPESDADPILHPCCQAQYIRFNCPSIQTNPPLNSPKMWVNWKQLTFDLSPYIGQTVKLRIISSECIYNAHYTYGYFTGFGVNGNLDVQSCSSDSTSIKAPVGFNNYEWYVNDVYIPAYDSLQMITLLRNTSDTTFKCKVVSETGDTFQFEKTIHYYASNPDFSWQQEIEDDLLKVQFINASTLLNNTNNDSVVENIDSLLWDFGDGTTSSEMNPIHYYSELGPFAVTLKIFYNNGLCSDEISTQVLLSGNSLFEAHKESISCKAYPNPFNEEIILEVHNSNEIVPFEISNLLGQVVYQGQMNHQIKVRTQYFKPGVYIVKFLIGNQTFYTKLVKE